MIASEKVLAVLVQLRNFLDTPKVVSIVSIFQVNELSSDYGTYLINDKIILRTKGGKAGRSEYQWNTQIEPTIELASLLTDRFNKDRGAQGKARNEANLSKTEKIFLGIEEIKRMQIEILSKLMKMPKEQEVQVNDID